MEILSSNSAEISGVLKLQRGYLLSLLGILIFGSSGSGERKYGQVEHLTETVLSDTPQFLLTRGLKQITLGKIQSTKEEWKNSTEENNHHGLRMCTKKLKRGQEQSFWEHSVSVKNMPRVWPLAGPELRGPGPPEGLGE